MFVHCVVRARSTVYEQQFGADDQLRLMGYYGYRSIVQYLSIPPGAQKSPLQSGGVVSPNTNYGGADARWTHHGELAGRTMELVLGWREGLTLSDVGSVTVNDIDTDRAADYGLIGADVSYGFALGGSSHLLLSVRVDNLADHRYVGSVIVNDGNGRYFEAGPDRSFMMLRRLVADVLPAGRFHRGRP